MSKELHAITYAEKIETVEYSHGREIEERYIVVMCSCGREHPFTARASNTKALDRWVRNHMITVLMYKAGIMFSEGERP